MSLRSQFHQSDLQWRLWPVELMRDHAWLSLLLLLAFKAHDCLSWCQHCVSSGRSSRNAQWCGYQNPLLQDDCHLLLRVLQKRHFRLSRVRHRMFHHLDRTPKCSSHLFCQGHMLPRLLWVHWWFLGFQVQRLLQHPLLLAFERRWSRLVQWRLHVWLLIQGNSLLFPSFSRESLPTLLQVIQLSYLCLASPHWRTAFHSCLSLHTASIWYPFTLQDPWNFCQWDAWPHWSISQDSMLPDSLLPLLSSVLYQ